MIFSIEFFLWVFYYSFSCCFHWIVLFTKGGENWWEVKEQTSAKSYSNWFSCSMLMLMIPEGENKNSVFPLSRYTQGSLCKLKIRHFYGFMEFFWLYIRTILISHTMLQTCYDVVLRVCWIGDRKNCVRKFVFSCGKLEGICIRLSLSATCCFFTSNFSSKSIKNLPVFDNIYVGSIFNHGWIFNRLQEKVALKEIWLNGVNEITNRKNSDV